MVLTRIPGLPATVVGVEAREKVTAEDYERVLIPAVEAAAAASSDGKVRVLYVLGREFPGFTAGAVWVDTKLALGPRRRWERIAVVSDAVWLRRAIRVVGWAIPGEVRVYASDQLTDARVWVTAPRQVSGARRFFRDVIIGFRGAGRFRSVRRSAARSRGAEQRVDAAVVVQEDGSDFEGLFEAAGVAFDTSCSL